MNTLQDKSTQSFENLDIRKRAVKTRIPELFPEQAAVVAKSISDAGWAQFRTILEGKAACAGRRVIAVPAASTSQDCSGCGARVEKSLSVRTHVCTSCGLILDRDENAAKNIQRAGQALQALTVAVAAVA